MYNRDFSNAESLLGDAEPNSAAKMVSALQKSVEEVTSSFEVQRVCSSGSMCKSSIDLHTWSHAHTLTCSHAHTLTCSCTHLHTCTHTHMHTCTHAHMLTCTHAHMYCTPQHVMITIAWCFQQQIFSTANEAKDNGQAIPCTVMTSQNIYRPANFREM